MSARPSWLDEFRSLAQPAPNTKCQLPNVPTLPNEGQSRESGPPFGTFDTFDIWHRDKRAYDPFADLPPDDPACRGEWQRWFNVLISHRLQIGQANRAHEEAAALAYGEAQCLWHERYGQRPQPHSCAGCSKPMGQSKLFALPDGASVHDDAELRCLAAYGVRWRTAAADALRRVGIVPFEDSVHAAEMDDVD
jgi:hypothetical protein